MEGGGERRWNRGRKLKKSHVWVLAETDTGKWERAPRKTKHKKCSNRGTAGGR